MSYWHTLQLLAALNLLFCLGIAWACICRLNTAIAKTYKLARLRYTLLLAGVVAHGAQPLFWGSIPSIADTVFSAAVLASLVLGIARWRRLGDPRA